MIVPIRRRRISVVVLLLLLNLSGSCQSSGNDSVPSFPGGVEKMNLYIKENMRWRQSQLTVEGSAIVSFVVTEQGKVTDVKIEKGVCESCDKEAIRLVQGMPNWIPAKKNGENVSSKAVIPIRFNLSSN